MQPIIWNFKNDNNVITGITWSCKKVFFSIDRADMNTRGLTEALDDKIMGDLAAIAVYEFLQTNRGLRVEIYDSVREDNFEQPDPGWDIRIKSAAPKSQEVKISVKSSRIPSVDKDNIEAVIRKRDFKIFANLDRPISECISADIEVQVYYLYNKSQLPKAITIPKQLVQDAISSREPAHKIADILRVRERFGECILTAWNTRERIISYSNSLPSQKRHWDAFGKKMWKAPLREGLEMSQFNDFL